MSGDRGWSWNFATRLKCVIKSEHLFNIFALKLIFIYRELAQKIGDDILKIADCKLDKEK